MIIKNITVTNFKSIYGTQTFDFTQLDGLIKLSGPIGVGKTTVGEAILYGLYGSVKGQNNGQLIAWNTRNCEVEVNLISKNKEINIKRATVGEPLIITVNGKTLVASNKRGTQEILEEELFDVPKLAVVKMCIISFNAFNNSLASMSAGETRQFLDEIFGFHIFSEFNTEIIEERKTHMNEATKLRAIVEENENQIARLIEKKEEQQRQIAGSVDLEGLAKKRIELCTEGAKRKQEYFDVDTLYKSKEADKDKERIVFYNKKMEYATLGRQHKEWINKFKSGVCPTCGHKIGEDVINAHKDDMFKCANSYREQEALEQEKQAELNTIKQEHQEKLNEVSDYINNLKIEINNIDNEVSKYNDAIQLISENYDDLIQEQQNKLEIIKAQLDKADIEIGEWNDMNELFSKTLRYNLLETLIPHINKSIKYFINKLDQSYKIEFDQEFKAHIYVDSFEKEIAYNNLSTGQRKSLDLAIIFGVLQNVIASVNFNIFFLDELFSNMDSDTRNIMLELLNETLADDRTVFVINHAEMSDDYFKHKIRVSLTNKKVETKKSECIFVKASKYDLVF